jgi:hypothetical protein
MSTAGGCAGIRVVIDERRPSSEAAVVADPRTPASSARRPTEPATVRTATDSPPRLAERGTSREVPPRPVARGTAAEAPPRLADRRPARDSVAAPYSFDDFPIRVVRSMHEAARAYAERVAEEIQLRRVAILTAIRDERRADVLRARAEAAQNRRDVERWATTAQRQIKSERQRRKVEIDTELRRTLREKNHDVDRRVREVEAAITAHRSEVDTYFEAIDKERDPVAIAEHARRQPAFPRIDPSASAAGAAATREPTDPVAGPDRPAWVQTELFDLGG